MALDLESLREALRDRYLVEKPIGEGAMAKVFSAWDVQGQRRVAVKVLDPDLAAAVGPERFLREIQIVASLDHPHIASLLGSGSAGPFLYLVLTLVEGETLAERLRREGQLSLEAALETARQVALALDYAHARGVVHRDIKPENILIEGDRVVVTDFGVARALSVAGGEKLTVTGTTIGTPMYMSPEQATGGHRLDGRTDIYSLGCVLYEMVAGEPPFTGATGDSIIRKHIGQDAPRASTVRPAVPRGIDHIIQRCLAKSPADRFRTGAQLIEALAAPDRVRPPRPRSTRRRLLVASALPVLLAVGALAALRSGALDTLRRPIDELPPPPRDWILVGDLDGPPDDPGLPRAIRNLLCDALDRSSIVAVVSRDQMEHKLELLGKPTDTRVTGKLAYEMAYRSSVRSVLNGEVSPIGPGYTISVRVFDVDSNRVLTSITDTARDQEALLGTVARIARDLRRSLGEKRVSLRSTGVGVVDANGFATGSFAAILKADEAAELDGVGKHRAAIVAFRKAMAMNPPGTSHWLGIGFAYRAMGIEDSARMAFDKAFAGPLDRIGRRFKQFYQAITATIDGDLSKALAIYDQVLRESPNSVGAPLNRSVIYSSLGRFEEAVADARRAQKVAPFGPIPGAASNECEALVSLGRLEEARRLIPGVFDPAFRRMQLAVAVNDWAAAESLARVLGEEPRWRVWPAATIGLVQAAQGALREAAVSLVRAERTARGDPDPLQYPADQVRRAFLLLSWASRASIGVSALEAEDDTTTAAAITRGIRAVIDGDFAKARSLLKDVRSRPARQLALQGESPALLEGWIASREGRWRTVVDLLGQPAGRGIEPGTVPSPAGRPALRWLVAEAYEHLGRPDSAARYYELAVSPLGITEQGLYSRAVVHPFALQRLVLLEAKRGRLQEAQRHWQILKRSCTRPDDAMRPFLDEARDSLRSAELAARVAVP